MLEFSLAFLFQEEVVIISLCVFGPVAIPLLVAAWTINNAFIFAVVAYKRISLQWSAAPPPMAAAPAFEQMTCESHDGLTINYHIARNGGSSRAILFASPLGANGPESFGPLLGALATDFTLISWDYRGWFGSDKPRHTRSICIFEHAKDGAAVLRAAGFESVHAVVGHSQGVQVALELSLQFPELAERLVLLNGTHGHAFNAALQPFCRVPLASNVINGLLALMLTKPEFLEVVFTKFVTPMLKVVLPIYAKLMQSRKVRDLYGDDYLFNLWIGYSGGLMRLKETAADSHAYTHIEPWLYTFREIHAHSVFHLLFKIKQPTLLLSGFWDLLLPPTSSQEIKERLSNAKHVIDPFSGHATCVESPEYTLQVVLPFVHGSSPCVKQLAREQTSGFKMRN